ncbi:MAG: glycoside hydrolase family 88 protein [Eubacteriales bacterium]|nr:glycoside hydrolase family 88 protein [Eubacteriales bacterium]
MQTWAKTTFDWMADKYSRNLRIAAEEEMIPYAGGHGRWQGAPYDGNSWWTGGFWPGLMWHFYAATGDEAFLLEARRVEKLLINELMTFEKLNHDVGFMYLLSCGADYKLTGDAISARHTLHAATLLAGRYNPNGFIRAWDQDRAGWSIIDSMMNLCLLYWATKYTGDPRFEQIACLHADTTLREFVREDGSCYHIVIFDPYTGAALEKPAGQGYAAGSSWSRGQAWALYGFTLTYMATRHARYLEAACRIADYFVAHIRSDGLTDSDFLQPRDVERIDNIAGACAACGLMELEKLVDPALSVVYHAAAEKMLYALGESSADWTGGTMGVLQKCTAAYHDDGAGRHINLVYGDYFFAEALAKRNGSDPMLWLTERG